jgi:hypothetical protein
MFIVNVVCVLRGGSVLRVSVFACPRASCVVIMRGMV